MLIKDIEFQSGTNTLKGTFIKNNETSVPTILSLHGAGKSNRNRIRYLLELLTKQGLSSFCFDFSGHGESTGALEHSSLAKRRQEAISAHQFLDSSKSLTVIGSSMGAHIAATLVDVLPIKTLILFCPAAYSLSAEEVTFNDAFSQIIRQPKSYVDSLVFEKLESFYGKLLLVSGTDDKVIPPEILDNYLDKAKNAIQKELVWIKGADHQIHPWLEKNNDDLNHVLAKILNYTQATHAIN